MSTERAPARRADAHRWLIDVADATDPKLCGGKAIGLARLRRAGVAVPGAVCLTTEFYRRWLEASGITSHVAYAVLGASTRDPEVRQGLLAELRLRIETAAMPEDLETALRAGLARLGEGSTGPLCVRSSGVFEDDADASHAGIHTSVVVADHDAIKVIAAVKACWASLWTDAAWVYRERRGIPQSQAAMAVVVQRFVGADRSGVAFSADPLTGDRATVVIEATRGAGAALVAGEITPDQYRITMPDDAPSSLPARRNGDAQVTVRHVEDEDSRGPVLDEAQVLGLARLAKNLETALQFPVDLEWVFDGLTFWVVQARPITALAAGRSSAHRRPTVWTRANLKEVFPELPSPLALSYLAVSLNRMFHSYHAAQGYDIPPETRLVSVFRGRPYLNLTLMQEMTAARGGDPGIAIKLFGGTDTGRPPAVTPAPNGGVGARLRLVREMLETLLVTPRRGRRLFRRIRRKAIALSAVDLARLDDKALLAHLDEFSARLLHRTTVRRLHEIVSGQSRAYMALELLLAAWITSGAESLVKRLMTGLGTLPNARMTYRLVALGALAGREPQARAFFAGELEDEAIREYRTALAGTRFLAELDEFLREFGHRGPYESDVMSARFAEDPAPVLRVIQLHLRAGAHEDVLRHAAERRLVRQAARDEVRERLRQGRGRLAFAWRWLAFSVVCDALQRLLALRDECRHVMTSMVAHLRQIVLEIGRRAARDEVLARPDDIFFLAWYELPRVLPEPRRGWRDLALARRRQREHDATLPAPDLIEGDERSERAEGGSDQPVVQNLAGFGVSPGVVIGAVKVLRSTEDVRSLAGEILVCSTMEPTFTPIFPLLRGMVTEMGGLLSHAAILAREYGLPAVVNVPDATRRLRDGDRIELDGTTGQIRILERCAR